MVGVAGGSASGKSTLCNMLKENLSDKKVILIHMDSYFKKDLPVYVSPVTGKSYPDHNHPLCFDTDRMIDDIKTMKGKDYDLIIIEGLLTLYNDVIRSMLDLKIFIDVQSDERLFRRIKRNMQWGLSMDEIASFYLDSVRFRYNEYVENTRWYADIVFNGSIKSDTGFNMILSWIRNNI